MFTFAEQLDPDSLKNIKKVQHQDEFERGIAKGRNHDEVARSQKKSDTKTSPSFTQWILKQVPGYTPPPEKEFDYRGVEYYPTENEWGEWPEDREDLSFSKNIAYKFAEVGLDVSIKSKLDDDLTETTNLISAELAVISISAYRKVLSFLANYNYPQGISNTVATKMLGIYLNEIYTQCKAKYGEDIARFLASQVDDQASRIVDQSKAFNNISHPNSQQYLELHQRIKEEAVQDKKLLPDQKNTQGHWLYYSATREWPYSQVDRVICSHCPGLPITDYYTRDFIPNGGILLTGKPIKFFCRDMNTHHDELMMGEGWSIEKFIETHKNLMYERAKEHHITQREEEQNNLEFNRYICNSLQEAWDRRKEDPRLTSTGAYTEIWLDDPQEYAIWVDASWKTNPDFHRSHVADATLRLLNQRPDLPVIDSTGSIVSRTLLVERILYKDPE